MPSIKKLHLNVFTILMIAAGLSFMFRAVNIVASKDTTAGAIMSAKAVEASDEKPPASTPGAVTETNEGPDSIKPPAMALPSDGSATTDKSLPPENSLSENRSFSAAEIDVLQSLSKRRDELDKREQQLSAREALMSAAEQEVDRKVSELNKLRGEIEELLGKQQKMEDDRIGSLVKIYESMKPKEAAAIFNTLDLPVLLSVISRMNERKSSPILASMNPDRARIVTIKLAEQRKLPSVPPAIPKALQPPALPATEPADTPLNLPTEPAQQ